ncbi:hypothetical protein PV325_013312, partial [Microctonus aethiopoides]
DQQLRSQKVHSQRSAKASVTLNSKYIIPTILHGEKNLGCIRALVLYITAIIYIGGSKAIRSCRYRLSQQRHPRHARTFFDLKRRRINRIKAREMVLETNHGVTIRPPIDDENAHKNFLIITLSKSKKDEEKITIYRIRCVKGESALVIRK